MLVLGGLLAAGASFLPSSPATHGAPPREPGQFHLVMPGVGGDGAPPPFVVDGPQAAPGGLRDQCFQVPLDQLHAMAPDGFRVVVRMKPAPGTSVESAIFQLQGKFSPGGYPADPITLPDGTLEFRLTFASGSKESVEHVSLCVRVSGDATGLPSSHEGPGGVVLLDSPGPRGPAIVQWNDTAKATFHFFPELPAGETSVPNPCFPGCFPQVVFLGGPVPPTSQSASVAAFHFSDFDLGYVRITPSFSGVNPVFNCEIAGDIGSIALQMPFFRGVPFFLGITTDPGSLGSPPDPQADQCTLVSGTPASSGPPQLRAVTAPVGLVGGDSSSIVEAVRLLNAAGATVDYTGYSLEALLFDDQGAPVARGELKLTSSLPADGQSIFQVTINGLDGKPLSPAQALLIDPLRPAAVRIFKRGG